MNLKSAAFFLGSSIASTVFAAGSHRVTNVLVNQSGDDSLGAKLAYEMKEKLRSSSKFAVAGDSKNAQVRLVLTTIDPDKDTATHDGRTMYAYVILFKLRNGNNDFWVYGTDTVGYCGARRIAECAADLVVDLDQMVADTP